MEATETAILVEVRKTNGEQLDKIAIAHLFQEKGEKSENIIITELCERYLRLGRRTNEHRA